METILLLTFVSFVVLASALVLRRRREQRAVERIATGRAVIAANLAASRSRR